MLRTSLQSQPKTEEKKTPQNVAGVKKTIDKKKAIDKKHDCYPKDKPPKYGVELPCFYNGCKIYGALSSFRVVPFPGKSVYDRQFFFKDNKGALAQWDLLIKYCKKPVIPSTSANAIK